MSDDSTAAENRKRHKLYRQISWYSKQAGLSREDIIAYAREMYDDLDDVSSTSDIATPALEDLLFGLKSWFAIQAVRRANGVLLVEAQVVIDRLNETAKETAERQHQDDSWE